jgi:hypothetical protein
MQPRKHGRQLPTFFILGAGKAGTTSLHYYLAQHPDILMSEPKEPAFFRLEYERGLKFYWTKYYRSWVGQRQIGDGDPRNLPLPFVATRIARSIPDARFVVLCRNPIERAVSDWWHATRVGGERRSFDEAMSLNLEWLEKEPPLVDEAAARLYAETFVDRGPRYVDAGHYAEHIERYIELFGRDRLEIVFLEDLAKDAEGTTADVVRFLGLEPVPLRDSAPQQTATCRLAATAIHHIARLPGVHRLPLSWRKPVHRLIGRLGRLGGRGSPPAPQATCRMLAEHYRPHNARLARLTGRDLGHWDKLAA